MNFRVRGLSFLPGMQHIVMEQMRLSAENWNPQKNDKKLLQKQIQRTVRSLDSGRAQLVSSWWESAIDPCTCELLPPDWVQVHLLPSSRPSHWELSLFYACSNCSLGFVSASSRYSFISMSRTTLQLAWQTRDPVCPTTSRFFLSICLWLLAVTRILQKY